jgi:hypothetical protein
MIHEENIEYMRKHSGNENRFRRFNDFEIQKMQRNLKYWRDNSDTGAKQKKNFYAFFNEHDRRRSTNFMNTFPEMEEFWEECRNA